MGILPPRDESGRRAASKQDFSGCQVVASDPVSFPTVEGHIGVGHQRNDEGHLQPKVVGHEALNWRQDGAAENRHDQQ